LCVAGGVQRDHDLGCLRRVRAPVDGAPFGPQVALRVGLGGALWRGDAVSPTEQRQAALERANRARIDGAAVRRELAAGDLTVAQALEDPRAQRLQIGRLLTAQRGWGPTKANRLLNQHRIFPTRRVGALTPRQRDVLAAATESMEARKRPVRRCPWCGGVEH
jgi:hypothetical protein